MIKKFEPKIFCPYFISKDENGNPCHKYTTPDGMELPSITKLFDSELDNFKYVDAVYAENGSNGHKVMELWDKNDLDMKTLDPYFLPHLAQYILALEIEKIKVEQNEVRRYHPRYYFAGTLDKIGKIDSLPGIIDIKLSSIKSKQYEWQTAAYKELIRRELGANLKRWCLYLKKDDKKRYETMGWGLQDYIKYYRENPKKSYSFIPHTEKRDFFEFLTFLNIYQVKKKYGLLKK